MALLSIGTTRAFTSAEAGLRPVLTVPLLAAAAVALCASSGPQCAHIWFKGTVIKMHEDIPGNGLGQQRHHRALHARRSRPAPRPDGLQLGHGAGCHRRYQGGCRCGPACTVDFLRQSSMDAVVPLIVRRYRPVTADRPCGEQSRLHMSRHNTASSLLVRRTASKSSPALHLRLFGTQGLLVLCAGHAVLRGVLHCLPLCCLHQTHLVRVCCTHSTMSRSQWAGRSEHSSLRTAHQAAAAKGALTLGLACCSASCADS